MARDVLLLHAARVIDSTRLAYGVIWLVTLLFYSGWAIAYSGLAEYVTWLVRAV